MKHNILSVFSLIALTVMLFGCRKSEFDSFYARPAWLESPIYQQLEAKENFKHLLAVIEKGGYKEILSKTGYWTFFAANDAAFEIYFKENNITGADGISAETAQKIVKYSLVYNAFKTDHLADYQSVLGWAPNMAFKRRTTYFTGIDTVDINGRRSFVIASNRNNNGGSNYYVSSDNNNKYIPYFLEGYFTKKGLTAADYNYFYADNPYNGFNVANAQVLTKDLKAENGVIHEINRVILPLPNIDQKLSSDPNYSLFKSLFDNYMVSYIVSAAATNKNRELTGSSENVYVKVFNSGLAYSPNNENYLKLDDNDGQMEGYSMFAPSNDALSKYINEVLLEHYTSLNALPQQILLDFLNAHMWGTTVWPGKFASTTNSQGQGAMFNLNTDIIDKKVLSNGIFYGTNKVQAANIFSSVFSKAYLDPAYSLMTRALSVSLKQSIINTNSKYSLFLVSDDALKAAGFSYDLDANTWRYTPPAGGASSSGSTAFDKLNRIINTHVVKEDLRDLSGDGIVETYEGEYVKYNSNTLVSAGNQEAGITLSATSPKITSNGTVYYVNRLLSEPTQAVGKHLEKLAATSGSVFKKFFDYLNNSTVYNRTTGEIAGISAGSFYTLLVPSNTAIDAAVAQGYLPSSNNPSSTEDKDKVTNFIRYHILQKITVVPDGKKEGGYLTLLQKENGDPTIATVTNAPGDMKVKDMLGNTAGVVTASSNNLSNRTVIHLVSSFLKFSTK